MYEELNSRRFRTAIAKILALLLATAGILFISHHWKWAFTASSGNLQPGLTKEKILAAAKAAEGRLIVLFIRSGSSKHKIDIPFENMPLNRKNGAALLMSLYPFHSVPISQLAHGDAEVEVTMQYNQDPFDIEMWFMPNQVVFRIEGVEGQYASLRVSAIRDAMESLGLRPPVPRR